MTAVPFALPEINVRPEDKTYPSLPPELEEAVLPVTTPEPEPRAFNPALLA